MEQGSDMVDLYEQMLSERAEKGIRPVLYISSGTDLECSMLILLGEAKAAGFVVPSPTPFKRPGHYFIKN